MRARPCTGSLIDDSPIADRQAEHAPGSEDESTTLEAIVPAARF